MALYTLLDAVANGLYQSVVQTTTTLTTGHVNVGGFWKVSTGHAVPVVTEYEQVLKVVKRAVPELTYVAPRGRGWGKLVSFRGSLTVSLVGVDVAREQGLSGNLEVSSGRLTDLAEPDTVLIFEHQARELDVQLGDLLTISAQTVRGANNPIDCRVVAIARDIGLLSNFTALVPSQTIHSLHGTRGDTTGALQIYLPPERLVELEAIAERLRSELAGAGYRVLDAVHQPFWMRLTSVDRESWTGQRMDVTTWEDEASYLMGAITVLRGLTTLMTVLLLIIVVTGIMNTMWIAVRERTREIGTLRTLGMERGGVTRLFVMEAFCLGALGATIGATLGALASALLDIAEVALPTSWQLFLLSHRLHVSVRPSAVLWAMLVITLTTALGALLPALRASRLRPVVAMSQR
jgi:ABC-type lipoprotein release transport system permease subunit